MLNKKRDLFYLFLLPFICISLNVYALDEFTTTAFKFKSDGLYLNGLISQPTNIEAKSLIIIVHGYGPTNVVKKNSYAEIRSRFTSLGIAVVVWDKPGCGLSEGVFDINQPIESSANEVVAAIKALQHMNAPGIKHVGLWGISRAGWIAPLAINKEPSINFWISVSGTDALENWGYLLKSNLALAGVPQTEVNALYMEWNNGNAIYRTGGSYNDYLQATKLLRQNSLYQRLTGQKYIEYPKGSEEYQKSRAEFVEHQKSFIEEKREFDINTGLQVYVSNFRSVLANIELPVLALFGSHDRNVDWKKTKTLYQETIGNNKNSALTVNVFSGADHNIRMSKSGSLFEMQSPNYWKIPYAEGYYKIMEDWLCANHFCQ